MQLNSPHKALSLCNLSNKRKIRHFSLSPIPAQESLKKKQKKIFNRFEKLNENAQGTGLGLSICQLIIEQLGGSIWIDPDYEEGSRFLFTHPIDKSDQGKEETR